MGIVFLAEDRRTHLPVAAKVMSRSLADPELQARFMKENQILASLNHRNIVRCYEITRSREGLPTIVMEYLKGVDFGAFEGRPFPELLPLMVQAAMGLAYLKERNILHRDLSPNNIFVTIQDDRRLVKILDFGVAKVLQEGSGGELTQTGEFLGKLAYASHELLTFGQIDFRSDIYSLGVIFFRLLTKRRPINVQNSRNYLEWVMAQENRAPIDFAVPEECPPIPPTLQALVSKMLAKKSDDRPQGYEEIIDALVAAQGQAEAAGLMPDPEAVSSLPSTETRKSVSGSPAGPGATPSPSGSRLESATGATGLLDEGAFPFTEAETKAPSSASRVGTDAMRVVASAGAQAIHAAPPSRGATSASASQVPDWLEQAGYDEQIQVLTDSRQGISRSPVHPVLGSEPRSRSVKRDAESILLKQRAESARKRKAVSITALVLTVLGGGAWAGWEFYVKPNLPSSSAGAATAYPPAALPLPDRLPSGSGAEASLPTPVPDPRKPASRTAKLGPEERRLVDSNVRGFFSSGDNGLIVVVWFRKPVNVSGFQSARIVGATDEAGRALPALTNVDAELRQTSEDPTGAMRIRLFVPGNAAAEAAGSLRSISLGIGPATIRAKFDKALFSSR
ncbi:MAG: protein kinase [Deltaproteobacteria bacterium]|nr:protein kinase [Deltaproteobacteria bacterium]